MCQHVHLGNTEMRGNRKWASLSVWSFETLASVSLSNYQMISPQKFTRDWKQILKAGLRWPLHIWSVVFSFLPILSYITEQLNNKPLKTHKQPRKKEENTTLYYANSWIHKCSLQWQGVQEWHTVYVSFNPEAFLFLSLSSRFPCALFVSTT